MAEYIERNAAIDALRRRLGPNTSPAQKNMLQLAAIDIRGIKAADVAPVVQGEWGYDSNAGTYHCPNCWSAVHERHEVFDLEANDEADLNFCPNCGAKMDGGVGNETD